MIGRLVIRHRTHCPRGLSGSPVCARFSFTRSQGAKYSLYHAGSHCTCLRASLPSVSPFVWLQRCVPQHFTLLVASLVASLVAENLWQVRLVHEDQSLWGAAENVSGRSDSSEVSVFKRVRGTLGR
jgi:hypothetical protein